MSSLNRHATATLGDVGTSKVQAMKTALLKMSLKVEVEAREELWSMSEADTLLEGADWVIGELLHYLCSNIKSVGLISILRCDRQHHHES